MRDNVSVSVIIPALNEETSIAKVIAAIPEWVDDIVVVDNGSTDATGDIAENAGARVVFEPRRGYGQACLSGIAALDNPDVIVFLDADFSDDPRCMDGLVDPIADGKADLVIGSRTLGKCEAGALTPQARFGNWLACRLIRLFWGIRCTDLGPFRAIAADSLQRLDMRDPDYGWTVEMQIKAASRGLRVQEAPVPYRRRIGKSKISGTLRGVIGAGTKILGWIFVSAADSARTWILARRSPRRLAIFTRFPVPGACKTRMIPALGPEGAAALQHAMTEHAFNTARETRNRIDTQLEVRFTGGTVAQFRQWLGAEATYTLQEEGDLGERMVATVSRAYAEGCESTVIIGSDCPGITVDIIEQAFEALTNHDIVLGPATDGGYYLVGLRRPVRAVFKGIQWGADSVFRQTLACTVREKLNLALLPPLDDVDRPEDLPCWQQTPSARGPKSLTVVIPALDEEENIGDAIESAHAVGDVDIIVADGGSHDRTLEVARARGARVVSANGRGRAAQMNAAAARARGDILLFLHADSRLPAGFAREARRILAHPGVAAGAFRLGIADPARRYRWIEALVDFRARALGLPYGDQALFMKRGLFERLGGFDEQPILEDVDMIRRLRRCGRVVIADSTVTTAARRWQNLGIVRTTLLNQLMIFGFFFGINRESLARVYARHKGLDTRRQRSKAHSKNDG